MLCFDLIWDLVICSKLIELNLNVENFFCFREDMDKFVIRNKRSNPSVEASNDVSATPNIVSVSENIASVTSPSIDSNVGGSNVKRVRKESICEEGDDIISDPALRKPINEYDPQIRDEIRRKYVVKGPCQPLSHDFVRSDFGKKSRCFRAEWFKRWEWL